MESLPLYQNVVKNLMISFYFPFFPVVGVREVYEWRKKEIYFICRKIICEDFVSCREIVRKINGLKLFCC